jgi:hypothetical protein
MNTDRLTDEQIEDIEARCGHALNGDAVSSDVRALLGERARLAAQVEELRSSVEHHAPDCEPCRNALAHAALAAPSVPPDRPEATEGVATGSERRHRPPTPEQIREWIGRFDWQPGQEQMRVQIENSMLSDCHWWQEAEDDLAAAAPVPVRATPPPATTPLDVPLARQMIVRLCKLQHEVQEQFEAAKAWNHTLFREAARVGVESPYGEAARPVPGPEPEETP